MMSIGFSKGNKCYLWISLQIVQYHSKQKKITERKKINHQRGCKTKRVTLMLIKFHHFSETRPQSLHLINVFTAIVIFFRLQKRCIACELSADMLVLRASVRGMYIFVYSDRKKFSKIKPFFTDSQSGCILSMFLKFWSISA